MSTWAQPIRERLRSFENGRPLGLGEAAVSIKLRVMGGCFHREHSPRAYALIDDHLAARPSGDREFRFEEHESGPEVIVFLAVATAGLTLAKSVLDLIAAIIKARSDGIKHGDRSDYAIELIVRRSDEANGLKEEKVLRVDLGASIDRAALESALADAATRLLSRELAPLPAKPERTPRKKSRSPKNRKK